MGLFDHTAHHFDRLWSSGTELRRGGPKSGFLQQATYPTRIICAGLLIGAAMTTHTLWFLVVIYFICALGALVSLIDINRYLTRNLLLVLIFAFPISLPGILGFVTPGHAFISIGPVDITVQGVKSVGFIVMRALCAVSITMLLMRSAGIQGVFRGLRELRLPAGMVAALQMSVSHIHVLGRTAHAMVHAFRARTLAAPPARRIYAATAIQGTILLQKSMRSSNQLHSAMLARGFEGEFPLVDPPRRLKGLDYALIAFCGIMLSCGIVT